MIHIVSSLSGINTTAGQDVTLTCRAPNNNNIIVVEWSRADLKEEYVLMYRDGHFVLDNQHPSFKNRVDLQDRQMKDGDVSLILENVTIDDNGTYECRIFTRGANCRKGAHLKTDPISIISLSVVDPPEKKIITAESGQKVTLTCRAPNNNIIVVKWSRADLEPDYVLLYRDDLFVPDNQHPSFKNRVDLQDRQMKGGNVSLILKNVTAADSEKYKYHAFRRGTSRRERALLKNDPISIIYLSVVDPPEFLPEPNVISSSLKSSTSPTTGIQLLLSNWSPQQLRPDTFTVNTLVYILFVLLMKETSHNL
ncbi:CD226 antigen-like [Simochromis diagramma]|uniref:CD226 antigen-like n=1 Tax=Simochromis diagramma TaxID=43689 RepID=UPI001A7E80C2|nr:CD226 antigen-like [Simochromis diagramma]